MVLDVPPGVDHVVVMAVEWVARLAGCMHRERALEILEVYDLALGWHCNDSIWIRHTKRGRIHRAAGAVDGYRSAVEDRLDDANPAAPQALVAESRRV